MRRYRVLLRVFPAAWRAHYGVELLRVLEEQRGNNALRFPCLDLLRSGLAERIHEVRSRQSRLAESGAAIVAFESAGERVTEARTRRRVRTLVAAALPLLLVALAIPFALRVEHVGSNRPTMSRAGIRSGVATNASREHTTEGRNWTRVGRGGPIAGGTPVALPPETMGSSGRVDTVADASPSMADRSAAVAAATAAKSAAIARIRVAVRQDRDGAHGFADAAATPVVPAWVGTEAERRSR